MRRFFCVYVLRMESISRSLLLIYWGFREMFIYSKKLNKILCLEKWLIRFCE